MSEPRKDMTQEEYVARFQASHKIEGYGIDGMTIHVPCPFCAAPDNLVHKIMDTHEAYAKGATCAECGRSWMTIIHEHSAQGVRFEVVQTGGDDPPSWFMPMRRVYLS
jgi:bacterioferritin-associated ferredoxin